MNWVYAYVVIQMFIALWVIRELLRPWAMRYLKRKQAERRRAQTQRFLGTEEKG